jgi:hypothetical protein
VPEDCWLEKWASHAPPTLVRMHLCYSCGSYVVERSASATSFRCVSQLDVTREAIQTGSTL